MSFTRCSRCNTGRWKASEMQGTLCPRCAGGFEPRTPQGQPRRRRQVAVQRIGECRGCTLRELESEIRDGLCGRCVLRRYGDVAPPVLRDRQPDEQRGGWADMFSTGPLERRWGCW